MADDLNRLFNDWVYDIERVLRSRRDALADDLRSDDAHVQKRAEQEVNQIHDWLYLPLQSAGKRPRGRPRDEASQHAIRALTLHLATSSSWREIALMVRGCNHQRNRPNPTERSCRACGEAIRRSAERLGKFLKSKGWFPNVLRRVELFL